MLLKDTAAPHRDLVIIVAQCHLVLRSNNARAVRVQIHRTALVHHAPDPLDEGPPPRSSQVACSKYHCASGVTF